MFSGAIKSNGTLLAGGTIGTIVAAPLDLTDIGKRSFAVSQSESRGPRMEELVPVERKQTGSRHGQPLIKLFEPNTVFFPYFLQILSVSIPTPLRRSNLHCHNHV